MFPGHGAALIHEGSQPEALNPRCSCGATMKEKYKSPSFTHPDFFNWMSQSLHGTRLAKKAKNNPWRA